MRQVVIFKPIKISAAVLRKNIRGNFVGGYEIVPVLSYPKMLYPDPVPENGLSGSEKNVFNISLHRSERFYRLAAYFRDLGSYNASRKLSNLGYLSENLFRSYIGLNRLTQALWSIYKSNDLRLSHSLLTLIRTINAKNATELDAFFEYLPKIVPIQKNIMNVLKSVDRSLFGRSSSRYVGSSVVNIGKHEISRHTNTVDHDHIKTTTAIPRITENFCSMTPLLMRIYEGIETGVYLYGADNYRNAKTLHRLTNSLWKVYLGQNMELSRSFSRLITRVHQENKSVELRNSENNMFSDDRSLKNLVNALRRAFSGSNLELRNSMISLFGDIHKAGDRKNISVNKNYDMRSAVGIIMLHGEFIPENAHTRLAHRIPARSGYTEPPNDHSRLEREIKTALNRLEAPSVSAARMNGSEDIVNDVLEKINRKQQLDWRLEKLQRGIF